MIYATYATGFRPGGANRRGTLPPYLADELVSYEIGAKSSFMDNRLVLNAAAFFQEWQDFQFPILGQNGLTEIKNANQAEITGFEADASFIPIEGLTLNGALSLIDAELTENYCGYTDASGAPATGCPYPVDDPTTDQDETAPPEAAAGTRLPVVPDLKATFTARYEFSLASYMAHMQGSVSGQTDARSSLLDLDQSILGDQEGFWITDFSVGVERDNWTLTAYLTNAFDERADLYDFVVCPIDTCGARAYQGTNQPRTLGVRFGQRF
jgi:outer membrane receptor protein involved in Fe transport